MPKDLQFWTKCAPPGSATSDAPVRGLLYGIGGLLALDLAAWVTMIVTEAEVLGCILGLAFLAGVILGLSIYMDWYDNGRLMCVQHDQCAIGVVVRTGQFADGDYAFDLALAPWTPRQQWEMLQHLIDEEWTAGRLPKPPWKDHVGTTKDVLDYLNGVSPLTTLAGSDRPVDVGNWRTLITLYQRLVRERFDAPGCNFHRRYLIKTDAVNAENPGTFDALPDDNPLPASGNPNPLFRCPEDDFEDAHIDHPFVYMHTEIEGHVEIERLANIRTAFSLWAIAYAAFCAICAALTAGAGLFFCGALGKVILSFLFFLIALLIGSSGNQPGKYAAPELGSGEPGGIKPTDVHEGDVVAVFGDWIVDMEHNMYFEIHPVKAWYLMARDPDALAIPPSAGLTPSDALLSTMRDEEFQAICARLHSAEVDGPNATISVAVTAVLSMVAGLTPPRSQIR